MLQETQTLTPAQIHHILQERARALARVPQAEHAVESISVMVMTLGAEKYGVEMKYVQEIRPLHQVTRVPGAPAFYAGIANLRGRLYPVLDLRRYLGLAESEADEQRRIVLVSAAGVELCLLVDDVLGVEQIAAATIKPLLTDVATTNRREVISGVTADLLALLDLETMLSDSQLTVDAQPVQVNTV